MIRNNNYETAKENGIINEYIVKDLWFGYWLFVEIIHLVQL